MWRAGVGSQHTGGPGAGWRSRRPGGSRNRRGRWYGLFLSPEVDRGGVLAPKGSEDLGLDDSVAE